MKIIKYAVKKFNDKYDEVWAAQSESRPDKMYTVALNKKGVWSCGCPRWTMNASRPDCKHIKFIKNFRENGFQQTEEVETPAQVLKALTRFSVVEV